MKLTADFEVHLKVDEVIGATEKAARAAMRDTVVAVANESIRQSPKLTGNNMRSIAFEASGHKTGEGIIDQSKVEGAVYSTSGYGGYLEVGTHNEGGSWRMAPRPYFKPALDRNFTKEKFASLVKGYLK